MGAAETGDEVIFERLNGAFSPVATMESCRSELVSYIFIGHEVAEKL